MASREWKPNKVVSCVVWGESVTHQTDCRIELKSKKWIGGKHVTIMTLCGVDFFQRGEDCDR